MVSCFASLFFLDGEETGYRLLALLLFYSRESLSDISRAFWLIQSKRSKRCSLPHNLHHRTTQGVVLPPSLFLPLPKIRPPRRRPHPSLGQPSSPSLTAAQKRDGMAVRILSCVLEGFDALAVGAMATA
jgi:hypothetical protein